MNAMEVFVERWYAPGTADTANVDASERTEFERLPEPLRRLYRLAAKRQLFGQNRLVGADDLVVKDGKLTFYVENQGVCEWAIDPSEADPPVFVRGNAFGDPWIEEATTLSGFLIQMVIYEAVLCFAPFRATNDGVSASELRKLKRKISSLALPAWAWSKMQFFGKNGIVGFALPNTDLFQVELAARERAPFEAIEDLISDWPDLGF
ncbi:hypothetical protein AKJ09_01676 [Labilithrix luteola]|uniref:SMI1/KNR4 family protein n=1 Tax=Labilithrix luteola TaxID=1391654 RepID=A0A0K1PNC0_9BACT|nr:hypothetical protein AKJ09_01676 [Labilithrix luteola]